jgi:hypothetical protein
LVGLLELGNVVAVVLQAVSEEAVDVLNGFEGGKELP